MDATPTTVDGRIPPGPPESYDPSQDLLGWMQLNFDRFGDIYRATIYGGEVYVISSPEYAEHVLLGNWRNFLRKGQAVKRIALSLGNGLISSNGEFWVSQRRMIQPAFRREAVGAHCGMSFSNQILCWRRSGSRRHMPERASMSPAT